MRHLQFLAVPALALALAPAGAALAGPYAPGAGNPGSTAIGKSDSSIKAWASGASSLVRGPQNISVTGGPLASFGTAAQALGPADADIDSANIVSLGDGGSITLTFDKPIRNGAGADFAVFENGFAFTSTTDFLELAYVDVSSDGVHFTRFASASLTPTATQVGSFGGIDPTNINGLAGKYTAGFGTPFDLSDLTNPPANLDLEHINYVKLTDVIGNINPALGPVSLDSLGNAINDPFTTAFPSGGFDADAVGVINQSDTPEPAGAAMGAVSLAICLLRRKR